MSIGRARVIKAAAVPRTVEPLGSCRNVRAHRISRLVAEARDEAQVIVQRAREQADALLDDAKKKAAESELAAAEAGRAEAAAALAAWATRLARAEAESDERALERTLALAGLLAERLVGYALTLNPAVALALARTALAEARGARKVRIAAHPEDARRVRESLSELPEASVVLEVLDEPDFRKGDLRLETELGTLDARLGTRLSRLTRHLRDTLRR